MRIKRRDLKLLIENLLNEEQVSTTDWTKDTLSINLIQNAIVAGYDLDVADKSNLEKIQNILGAEGNQIQNNSWEGKPSEAWKKLSGKNDIPKSPLDALEAIKMKGLLAKGGGKLKRDYNFFKDKLLNPPAGRDRGDWLPKKDNQKAKKAEDVSDQEGKIIQDPAAAAYNYKKVGNKHYIISSPKDKKVSAKNATFVDPNSMKVAFDAISKLFK